MARASWRAASLSPRADRDPRARFLGLHAAARRQMQAEAFFGRIEVRGLRRTRKDEIVILS